MRHHRLRTAACALILFLLNLYLCRELFVTEYTVHLGSIEAAYISISRYLMDNWADLSWFPLWYTGIPFQNTYPPLFHLLVALVAELLHISPALSHHAVAAAVYCLGPVTLFWMAYRISGVRGASFAAGLLYSTLSPAGLLIYGVRKDMGGLLHARRLQTLVQYGEGPHILSLSLLPLAVLALHWALHRRRLLPAYLAAAALASVVLANFIGGAALLMAAVAYLLSGLSARALRTWRDTALIALLAYILAGSWIPPTTLLAIRTNAQKIGGEFAVGAGQFLFGVLLLAAAFLLSRLRVSCFLRFCLLFTFFVAGVTLSAEWRGFFPLPQPHRYHLEMEMGLCLTLAFAARQVFGRLGRAPALAVLGVLLVVAAWQTRNYRRYARGLIQPLDITTTIEYRMARWLERNFPGRRVMVQGTVSFWLNAFTDLPQLGGGFEQGIVNTMNRHVIYGLYANQRGERGGEYGVLWLKAYGVQAVAVGGPRSREYYKPIRDPDKFRGLLPELWREDDDAIFGVPHPTNSLARVIPRSSLVPRKPANALDAEPLRPYVAALDDPFLPEATFQWHSRHHATIHVDLPPDHLVSVQITYHPGWRALVNGRETPIQRDNLDLMVIDPGWDGPMSIDLDYDGGLEMRLLQWLRWCALLYLAVHYAGSKIHA